jgi:hypothetical protein
MDCIEQIHFMPRFFVAISIARCGLIRKSHVSSSGGSGRRGTRCLGIFPPFVGQLDRRFAAVAMICSLCRYPCFASLTRIVPVLTCLFRILCLPGCTVGNLLCTMILVVFLRNFPRARLAGSLKPVGCAGVRAKLGRWFVLPAT